MKPAPRIDAAAVSGRAVSDWHEVLPASGILLGAVLFGTAGVFVKNLDLSAPAIACLRLLIPALILHIWYPELRRRMLRAPNKPLLAASCLTALRILLWVLAFLLASLSKAIVALYTWPLLLAVFSSHFLKERIQRQTMLLLASAFIGVVLIYGQPDVLTNKRELLGLTLMLMVAVLNAAVMVIFKQQLSDRSPLEVILYDNTLGAVIFFPFLVFEIPNLEPRDALLGVSYGFLVGFLAYRFIYYGLSRLRASVAGVLSYVEVPTASLFGILLFGEELNCQMVIGAGLVLISSVLVTLRRSKSTRNAAWQ